MLQLVDCVGGDRAKRHFVAQNHMVTCRQKGTNFKECPQKYPPDSRCRGKSATVFGLISKKVAIVFLDSNWRSNG
jgi:hypothetical protein